MTQSFLKTSSAFISIVANLRQTIINSARNMAKRLYDDHEFRQTYNVDVNMIYRSDLSKNLFLSQECRILKQDQDLLDLLDDALAGKRRMEQIPQGLLAGHSFLYAETETKLAFFGNPSTKRCRF